MDSDRDLLKPLQITLRQPRSRLPRNFQNAWKKAQSASDSVGRTFLTEGLVPFYALTVARSATKIHGLTKADRERLSTIATGSKEAQQNLAKQVKDSTVDPDIIQLLAKFESRQSVRRQTSRKHLQPRLTTGATDEQARATAIHISEQQSGPVQRDDDSTSHASTPAPPSQNVTGIVADATRSRKEFSPIRTAELSAASRDGDDPPADQAAVNENSISTWPMLDMRQNDHIFYRLPPAKNLGALLPSHTVSAVETLWHDGIMSANIEMMLPLFQGRPSWMRMSLLGERAQDLAWRLFKVHIVEDRQRGVRRIAHGEQTTFTIDGRLTIDGCRKSSLGTELNPVIADAIRATERYQEEQLHCTATTSCVKLSLGATGNVDLSLELDLYKGLAIAKDYLFV